MSRRVTIMIDDDLNTDTSADYDEVALGADHAVTFGYDYSVLLGGTLGPAPNTTDASTTGVLMVANQIGGAASAVSLFHKTLVPANARVTVDLYMGLTGTGGTTEYGAVGLGSTATTPFTIFAPIAGDGTYMTHSTGDGTSSDWRWSRPGADPVGSDSVPMNSTSTTYLQGSSNDTEYDTCCGLVEDPVNGTNAGRGGNQWVTLEITTFDGDTRVQLNGTTIILGPSIGAADDTGLTGGTAPGGRASMSYMDVFASLASPGNSQFGVFDNFRVEAVNGIPEPTSMMLLGLGAIGLNGLARRRR